MQFTTAFLVLLGVAVIDAAPSTPSGTTIEDGSLTKRANSWAGQTFTGTSCQGGQLFWTVPDGFSCTNLASVSSLRITNFGGCSTTYFTGSGCQGSPVHVNAVNSCRGYAQGERIGSFSVQC
ncbi:hypothetical protein HD806DRAFT_550254 [Xylariaceae sp. AK1471]|nr:hypothetical protein HD806DRAFT_550254 [Xylariaceae sp. AK1471]